MTGQHSYALILAGGRGTRFWPKSRKRSAKQVLDFLGVGTMIQQTVARLAPVVAPDRVWVLTNEFLRAEIVRQLPWVPKEQILAEPAQRNTAPAIGLAAHILTGIDPDAVMGVFPADHFIERPAAFHRLIRAAYREASKGKLVLLGIRPRWAETGYGYVEFPKGGMKPGSLKAAPVVRFREKPDTATAREFVEAGHFGWNAGMFFWRADVIREELRKHLPETAAIVGSLPPAGHRAFKRKLAADYPKCENISIDFAVMEKAQGVVGFAAGDVGWNDVGSWNAIHELARRDAEGNALRTTAIALESSGNLVDAPGKLVALVGVKDLVIVDTGDALLVASRAEAQKVGDVVKVLEKIGGQDLL